VLRAPPGLDALSLALRGVAGAGDAILIRGALVARPPAGGVYRRMVGGGFNEGAWAAQARSWVALDLDGAEVDVADPWLAVSQLLPEPLAGAGFVWNLTASHGLKPGLRARLFFLLSSPVADAQWRRWVEGAPPELHIDSSLFNAVQPHYIADPQFHGLADPVPAGGRWGVQAGAAEVVDADALCALPTGPLDTGDLAHVGSVVTGIERVGAAEMASRIDRIRRQTSHGSRHEHMIAAACELIGLGLAPELAEAELEDVIHRQGRDPDPGEVVRAIKHALGKLAGGRLKLRQAPAASVLDAADAVVAAAPPELTVDGHEIISEAPDPSALLYGPNDLLNAGLYKDTMYPKGGFIRWAEQDWEWTGQCWRRLENEEVLVSRIQKHAGLKSARAKATAASFRSLVLVERMQQPCCLDGSPLGRVLIFRNGVLDVDAWLLDPGTPLLPHDPNRFVTNSLPYDYVPEAKAPRLTRFLASIWPEQMDQRREYQKMLGYVLLAENPLHKMFILMGSPRSGKGTTLRLIRGLVGSENCCSPNLSSLANDFGLDPLVGKSVALIGEMNQQQRPPDSSVDRIKGITGGDALPVNRKSKGEMHIVLPVRFVIGCNRLPGFLDPSGALAARIVLLTMWNSFTGREDRNLDREIMYELPGIAQFALAGLRMLLVDDGDFITSESSARIARSYQDTQAPMRAFLSQYVQPCPGGLLSKRKLYTTYGAWARDNGHHTASSSKLATELAARWPHEWESSEDRRHGTRGERDRAYTNFAFTSEADEYLEANTLPNEADT
jgi:P4 family phage/plasmid primase-like protien